MGTAVRNILEQQGPLAEYIRDAVNKYGLGMDLGAMLQGASPIVGNSISEEMGYYMKQEYEVIDEVNMEHLGGRKRVNIVLPKPRYAHQIFRPCIKLSHLGFGVLMVDKYVAEVRVHISVDSLKRVNPTNGNNTRTLGAMSAVIDQRDARGICQAPLFTYRSSLSQSEQYLVCLDKPAHDVSERYS